MDNQSLMPQPFPSDVQAGFTTPKVTFMHPHSFKVQQKISSTTQKVLPAFGASFSTEENNALIKKGRPKNSELLDNYLNALVQYCTYFSQPWPPILFSPQNLFYTKGKNVYFVFPLQQFDQNGSPHYHKKLKPATWPIFLSAMTLPFQNCAPVTDLYQALYTFLTHLSIDSFTASLQQIYIRFPGFARNLALAAEDTVITPDGVLLLKVFDHSHNSYRVWSSTVLLDLFSETDLFMAMQNAPNHMPCQPLIRPFFRELYKRKKNERQNISKSGSKQFPNLVYFIDGRYPEFHKFYYQKAEDYSYSFVRQVGKADYNYGKKFIIKSFSSEDYNTVSPTVASFLSALTGGSVETLRLLCKLFYRLMKATPDNSFATIVYSPINAQILPAIFNSLFQGELPSFPYPRGKTSIRLNTLTQKKHLMALAQQNILGCPFLLIDDTSPSPASYELSYGLSQGKSIALSDEYVVEQRFKNQVHLLCITDNLDRAENLSSQLHVPLMDFSGMEQPIPRGISFTENEKQWLCWYLPLYGMWLESCVKLTKVKKSKRKGSADDSLKSFLTSCCCAGNFISTSNLFDAYCEYYSSLHGNTCPYNRILFTRKVKASREYLPTFEHKKLRVPSAGQVWYFAGISLKENWRSLIPPPLDSRVTDDFEDELSAILQVGGDPADYFSTKEI